MGLAVRMGVACATQACGNEHIDGLFVGTGLGGLQSAMPFLKSMREQDEKCLMPSDFMQATHNAIASQLGNYMQCHGHNTTHSQRFISFENALLDASRNLQNQPQSNYLAGAVDLVNDADLWLGQQTGLYTNTEIDSAGLFAQSGDATIAGEGASFFWLSGKPRTSHPSLLKLVHAVSYNHDKCPLDKYIMNLFGRANIKPEDVQLVLLGKNGNSDTDKSYLPIQSAFQNTPLATWKQLCGEYQTSTGFALWLAHHMIRTQVIPNYLSVSSNNLECLSNILVVNIVYPSSLALMLISKP